MHNSLISQLYRRPGRNVLHRPPACACMSNENDCGQLARGALSDTLRTLSVGGGQCERCIRRPGRSTERPEHSRIVGSQLYYTWERRGTGCTPGTTHTNTATRRIKWSRACTGAATVYIWAQALAFTDATWSKRVHKSCRRRKCKYKHSFKNKQKQNRHFLLFKTHSLLLYSTFGSHWYWSLFCPLPTLHHITPHSTSAEFGSKTSHSTAKLSCYNSPIFSSLKLCFLIIKTKT